MRLKKKNQTKQKAKKPLQHQHLLNYSTKSVYEAKGGGGGWKQTSENQGCWENQINPPF